VVNTDDTRKDLGADYALQLTDTGKDRG